MEFLAVEGQLVASKTIATLQSIKTEEGFNAFKKCCHWLRLPKMWTSPFFHANESDLAGMRKEVPYMSMMYPLMICIGKPIMKQWIH